MQDQPNAPSPKEPSSPREPRAKAGASAGSTPSGLDLGPMREVTPRPAASGSKNQPNTGSVNSGGSTPRASMGPAAGLPTPGERLDVFEVEEAIGVGGMGAVFRAVDTRLERLVALKVLPPELAADPENVRRFYQEARAAARLDHENIARVFTIGQDKGVGFIAFEFIDGTNIRQKVERQGPLSGAECINYSLQIAGALVHAAERGVIHRDIKPSNLIVTAHGRAKLVDMGLARRFERTGADDGLTQSGMTLGTFDYISPEQARDPRAVDVRSDLYSLGCTMFHMLTGQPPFPGGTVLQKLLAHREELAPDVRSLNPGVPPELAAIILRLMAKEPDRRYQSPEQLLRELLALANALGLRSTSPEGLVWTEAQPAPSRPAWEQHLVWGVPLGLLTLIVGGLIWIGRDPAPGEAGSATAALEGTPLGPTAVPGRAPGSAAPVGTQADDSTATTKLISTPAQSAQPAAGAGPILVAADQDLAAALRAAPEGATIVLTEPGPYRIAPLAAGSAPIRRSLTIRAEKGIRPVLRSAAAASAGAGAGPLLHVQGAGLTLEGLVLDLGSTESGPAVRADRAKLVLRDCLVRGQGRPAAIEIVAPAFADSGPGRPPEPTLIEGCHFDQGRVAVLGHGSVDLGVRDCTFATAQPVVWIDNATAEAPVPARIWLSHVSVLAGADPILRLDGTSARVRVLDSVFAPALDKAAATLVAIDDPALLDWSGRDNVYSRMGTFLLPTRQGPGLRSVPGFASWVDSRPGPREIGSIATQNQLWARSDPDLALAGGADPADAFRLGPAASGTGSPGARRTSTGPIIPPPASLLARSDRPIGPIGPIGPDEATPTAEPTTSGLGPPSAPGLTTGTGAGTGTGATSPSTAGSDPSAGGETSPPPMTMPEEPPDPFEPMVMPPVLPEKPENSAPAESGTAVGSSTPAEAIVPTPPTEAATTPAAADRATAASTDADGLVRTESEFLDRIRLLGPRGGVVRLASGADIVLPGCSVQGSGLLEIVGDTGATGTSRPLLRFRPRADATGSAADWPALFRVRSGGLKLRGVDLLLEEDRAPASGRWAAFAVASGASLDLERCTVTLAGSRRSAAIRVQAAEAETEGAGAATGLAAIRLTHSFLRCGDDVVDIAAGRRLDLALTNVVVSAAGSLVHGHALPPGQADIPLKIDLRQVHALAAGGLVRLDSALGEPDLPVAEITARESVFSTGPAGTALVRIDGQGEVDDLADRVRWEGDRVSYHNVDLYRRDQSALPGSLPRLFQRADWEMILGRQDRSAFHGNSMLVAAPDSSAPPWTHTPADFRLDAESPSSFASPDLTRIPSPPSPSPDLSAQRPSPAVESFRRLIQGLRFN